MHTILHIGAGKATELNEWLATGAQRIILVEPNPILCKQLRNTALRHPAVTVVEAAITNDPSCNLLHEYNLLEASSLRPAKALNTRYPGLKATKQHKVATLSPGQLLEQYGPEPGQPATLAIQAPGEEQAILQTLIASDQLKCFSQLMVSISREPLYEGYEGWSPAQSLLDALQEYGYDIASEDQQVSHWPTWHLRLSAQKAQLGTLRSELENTQEELQGHRHKHSLGSLVARMEQLFSQQATQLQQATNALGKHVTQSFSDQRQHFQAVIGLNQYLETGQRPLELGGWAIGVDLASHLLRIIEQHRYDAIIEFGSGTSTVLMARSVKNVTALKDGDQDRELEFDVPGNGVGETHREPRGKRDGHHPPLRILSFEQSPEYQQHTSSALAREGLGDVVDLVLAPLVPTRLTHQPADSQPLFYDCEQELSGIARRFEGDQARILILVDGPSTNGGNPLAREPAMASVLQHLASHQLHFLLDDSRRQGEQQVAAHWRLLCDQRGLPYREQRLHTEKGALWVTINP
jgi:FkbM family methyltransferase